MGFYGLCLRGTVLIAIVSLPPTEPLPLLHHRCLRISRFRAPSTRSRSRVFFKEILSIHLFSCYFLYFQFREYEKERNKTYAAQQRIDVSIEYSGNPGRWLAPVTDKGQSFSADTSFAFMLVSFLVKKLLFLPFFLIVNTCNKPDRARMRPRVLNLALIMRRLWRNRWTNRQMKQQSDKRLKRGSQNTFVGYLNQQRISLWPKTAEKRTFCTSETDGPTDGQPHL